MFNRFIKKTSSKIKNIKNIDRRRVVNKKRASGKMFSLFSKLTEKIDDREKIRIKLFQAGEPFKEIGINENNYTSAKILFSLFTLLMMKNGEPTWIKPIVFAIIAWGLIEWYVYRKKKKRHKEIEIELDSLISNTILFLEQGFNQSELLTMLSQRIKSGNPLHTEIVRAKIKIASNKVNTNINDILKEFMERIGMEEIDNYCLALMQYDESGKAIRILKKQLELIRNQENQKQQRQTQRKAQINSISIALLVINVILIIVIPMIIVILNNPIFKK